MKTIFELEQRLHDEGCDLNAIRQEWMETSREKGWALKEEGWRRWLERRQDMIASLPKRANAKPRKERPVPPEFTEWWKTHREAGYNAEKDAFEATSPKVAWICQCFREEYAADSLNRGGAETRREEKQDIVSQSAPRTVQQQEATQAVETFAEWRDTLIKRAIPATKVERPNELEAALARLEDQRTETKEKPKESEGRELGFGAAHPLREVHSMPVQDLGNLVAEA